ncbi:hypothetical protein E6C27_scaffold498G001090 [Cucumis melo var. makuwa]|uniref:Uncharacterized protein n=1 Tax=Cucumis melo var. makuwa TaxID=1194695 RepID=A0A5A7TWF8_CUCMM|nr:hypothetical protein E6C27_scaffold498G001090 [Cucumis melo var. makuwa]
MRIRPSPPKYDDEYFKFIKNNFGKPMRDGFEDIFQCQANLQEGMRSQKQLQNLELRIDNKDLRHQAQLDIIEVDIVVLKNAESSVKHIDQASIVADK